MNVSRNVYCLLPSRNYYSPSVTAFVPFCTIAQLPSSWAHSLTRASHGSIYKLYNYIKEELWGLWLLAFSEKSRKLSLFVDCFKFNHPILSILKEGCQP